MWQRLHSALPATREVYLRVNETDLRALFDELGELREALKLSSVERQKLQERLRELELQLGDEECKGALPP